MSLLLISCVLLWASVMSLQAWGTHLTLKRLSTPPPHLDAPFRLYPVSILKPLKGIDSGLPENLESFFQLDYPEYEILFSVADPADAAIPLIRRLIQKHPHVPAKLIIGEVIVGFNPKVNNLIQSYEEARYDFILISDSNVRVQPSYLKRMIAHLENGVGILTAMVHGNYAEDLGGYLESIYLNTFYIRGMSLAYWVDRPVVIGKSMLFQKSVAERFGGVKTLARYIAEDYMAGEIMKKLGFKVTLISDPIEQYIGQYSIEQFWNRHLRWGRIRKSQAPIAFLFEPLSQAMVIGFIGGWAIQRIWGLPFSTFLALHLSLWAFCDYLILRKLKSANAFWVPIAWLIREMIAFPQWVHVALGNTVKWRGQKLRLSRGGLVEDFSMGSSHQQSSN